MRYSTTHTRARTLSGAVGRNLRRPYGLALELYQSVTDSHIDQQSLRARLAKGATWSLMGSAIAQVQTLAASILVARILGAHSFGEYGMTLSTIAMFGTLAGLGLGLTTTKYVAELRNADPARAGRIAGMGMLLSLLSSVPIAAACYALAPRLAGPVLGAPHLSAELQIGCALMIANTILGAQAGILAGLEAFRTLAITNVIRGFIILPVVPLSALAWGVRGALIGTVAATAVSLLLSHGLLLRDCKASGIRLQWTLRRTDMRVLWTFSLPVLLSSMIVVPATWITNTLLVRQPDGYTQLGFFNAANQWKLALTFVPGVLSQLALPVLSSLHGSNSIQRYRKVLLILVLLATAGAAVPALVICLGAHSITRLYGRGFENATVTLAALSAVAVLMAANNVIGSAIAAGGKVWSGLAFNILWACCFVGLAVALVPRYRCVGLSLALLIAYVAHTGWQSIYLWLTFRKDVAVPESTDPLNEAAACAS